MDAIGTTIVTGIFTLIGVVITTFKEEIVEMCGRGRNVDGMWEGESHDIEVPNLLIYSQRENYPLVFRLKQIGKRVTGEYYHQKEPKRRHKITKGRVNGDYLILEYAHWDRKQSGFGQELLRIDGTGETMSGFFLGRRRRDDGFVFGNTVLKKKQ